MHTKKTHLKWSNSEKLLVWLSFHMDIPYKDISNLLDRTLSSVQKAISRYGLREHRPALTEEIRQELLRLLQNPHASLPWVVRTFTERFPEILTFSPWSVNTDNCDTPPTRAHKKLTTHSVYDEWNDWSEVITYLKHKNIAVAPVIREKTTDHSYIVQGQLMDKKQLFLCANRMRAERGLSPLLVPGITFTH